MTKKELKTCDNSALIVEAMSANAKVSVARKTGKGVAKKYTYLLNVLAEMINRGLIADEQARPFLVWEF